MELNVDPAWHDEMNSQPIANIRDVVSELDSAFREFRDSRVDVVAIERYVMRTGGLSILRFSGVAPHICLRQVEN